jgi:hypothetical protein
MVMVLSETDGGLVGTGIVVAGRYVGLAARGVVLAGTGVAGCCSAGAGGWEQPEAIASRATMRRSTSTFFIA